MKCVTNSMSLLSTLWATCRTKVWLYKTTDWIPASARVYKRLVQLTTNSYRI